MTIALLQRWTRDDWVIPCAVKDPSGTAINLTGKTIAAEFWRAGSRVFSPLTVANNGIVMISTSGGTFKVVVPRLLTAGVKADGGLASLTDRTRVLIYWVDANGRQTLGLVPFEVFDGSEGLAIDEVPPVLLTFQSATFTLQVASQQGPGGPSNIAAANINDSSEVGQQLLTAANAAAIRALLNLPGISRHAVADTNYTVQTVDSYVALTALTAPRTITLPAAAAFPLGQPLWIADESGDCSTDTPIIIAGAGSDTIAGQPSVLLASPYQKLALHSNGTNLWTI